MESISSTHRKKSCSGETACVEGSSYEKHAIAKLERSFVFLFSIAAVVCTCALFLIYHHENSTISLYDKESFPHSAIENVQYSIESVSTDQNGNCTITGWFIQPGVTYSFYNYGNDATRSGVYNYLNICFVDGESTYVLPTKLEERSDVNDFIGDGINYRYSGFHAYIPSQYSYLLEKCSLGFLSQNPDGAKTLYVQE